MRTKQELQQLLEKYSQGKTSPQEATLLELWFLKMGESHAGYEISDNDLAGMIDKLHQSPRYVESHQTAIIKPFPSRKWLFVAASISAIVVFSLLFFGEKFGHKEGIAYVTVQTGPSEVKKVAMPDSSTIILNANTKLIYPEDFKTDRRINLSGEAVFKVKRDKRHPFVVRTNDSIETQVLGTEFNIHSYPQSKKTTITVLTGQVGVKKVGETAQRMLEKNEALVFDNRRQTFTHFQQTATFNASWVNGQWEFKDSGLNELAVLLLNQYGVHVHSKNKMLDLVRIDANFHKGQKVNEIVEMFCLLTNSKYRWKDETKVELY